METTYKTKIIVHAKVYAPIEKVWEYFTEPQHICKWNHASLDWHCPRAENDLRVGGKFKYNMAAKDGSTQFDFGGTYTQVVIHKMIAYTIDDGREVEITFDEQSESVLITETFEAEEVNSTEMQQHGWQAILNNFTSYTEEN